MSSCWKSLLFDSIFAKSNQYVSLFRNLNMFLLQGNVALIFTWTMPLLINIMLNFYRLLRRGYIPFPYSLARSLRNSGSSTWRLNSICSPYCLPPCIVQHYSQQNVIMGKLQILLSYFDSIDSLNSGFYDQNWKQTEEFYWILSHVQVCYFFRFSLQV